MKPDWCHDVIKKKEKQVKKKIYFFFTVKVQPYSRNRLQLNSLERKNGFLNGNNVGSQIYVTLLLVNSSGWESFFKRFSLSCIAPLDLLGEKKKHNH